MDETDTDKWLNRLNSRVGGPAIFRADRPSEPRNGGI